MTAPRRARPCPLCESMAVEETHVVGIYRQEAFREHVMVAHPGFDWETAWLMPMPKGRPSRQAERDW